MDKEIPAQNDAPERISHRYHVIRVIVTLSTIGVVTMAVGFASLADPDNIHPIRYLAGCAVVAAVCAAAVVFVRRRGSTTATVEAAMLVGLVATYLNSIYDGLLEVDPWWQVSGYLVVILIAGGVSLRRWGTFTSFIIFALVAWTVAIAGSDESFGIVFDTYLLILLGCVVSGAILWLFQIERERVTLLNRELQASATRDSLTGVMNRHGLLSTARLAGADGREAWCAYVDVDYFKSINDRRGHDHGDEVLRAVAVALEDSGGQLTARWGGDEFVTLGFGLHPGEDTIQDRVNRGIREVEPGASVTVGLATGPARSDTDLDHLMRKADRRMYSRRAEARGEKHQASA